jgi:hypothetical protein
MDVSGILWGVALLLSILLYTGTLFLIWKMNKPHSSAQSSFSRGTTSPHLAVYTSAPTDAPIGHGRGISQQTYRWEKPLTAIDKFAEANRVETKNKCKEIFDTYIDMQFSAERKVTELEQKLSYGYNVSGDLGEERRRLERAGRMVRIAEDDLRQAWASLRDDMKRKLEDGVLVAKGIIEPHSQEKEEVEIPAHEWRIMEMNPIDETAIGKNDNAVKYIGLMIAKRD